MARSEIRHRAIRRLQGLGLLVVVAALVALTIVIYAKKLPWQHSDEVTVAAQSIGNQLIIPADVKYNGVLVGRVSAVHSTGQQATITLQIDPSKRKQIPQNVLAQILPKTLFGEKFVDLVNPPPPASPSTTPLQVGQVIPQDRSKTAVELQDVFEKLVPVLRALNPAALSVALSNTAQAVNNRGNELGQSLSLINRYFKVFNADLPNVEHDIGGLADLAHNYADAAPNLLSVLHNFSVTARTFTVKRDPFAQFLAGAAGFADTATQVLQRNGNGLIKLAHQGRPSLDLLSRYSIVLECLPKGLSVFDRTRLEAAFAGGELHVNLIPVNSRGVYKPFEKPSVKEFTRTVLPANCYGLPYGGRGLHPVNSKYPLSPGGNYNKGGVAGSPTSSATSAASPSAVSGSTLGVGSAAEQQQIGSLLGPLTGGSPQANGLGDLLLGPMLRGMAVTP